MLNRQLCQALICRASTDMVLLDMKALAASSVICYRSRVEIIVISSE